MRKGSQKKRAILLRPNAKRKKRPHRSYRQNWITISMAEDTATTLPQP